MNFIFPNSWDDDPQICFICFFLYLIGGLEHVFFNDFPSYREFHHPN